MDFAKDPSGAANSLSLLAAFAKPAAPLLLGAPPDVALPLPHEAAGQKVREGF